MSEWYSIKSIGVCINVHATTNANINQYTRFQTAVVDYEASLRYLHDVMMCFQKLRLYEHIVAENSVYIYTNGDPVHLKIFTFPEWYTIKSIGVYINGDPVHLKSCKSLNCIGSKVLVFVSMYMLLLMQILISIHVTKQQ